MSMVKYDLIKWRDEEPDDEKKKLIRKAINEIDAMEAQLREVAVLAKTLARSASEDRT